MCHSFSILPSCWCKCSLGMSHCKSCQPEQRPRDGEGAWLLLTGGGRGTQPSHPPGLPREELKWLSYASPVILVSVNYSSIYNLSYTFLIGILNKTKDSSFIKWPTSSAMKKAGCQNQKVEAHCLYFFSSWFPSHM